VQCNIVPSTGLKNVAIHTRRNVCRRSLGGGEKYQPDDSDAHQGNRIGDVGKEVNFFGRRDEMVEAFVFPLENCGCGLGGFVSPRYVPAPQGHPHVTETSNWSFFVVGPAVGGLKKTKVEHASIGHLLANDTSRTCH
jgi:hypothetical protein